MAASGTYDLSSTRLVIKTRVGATLVELLVVISIAGVLMALLLTAIQSAREAARQSGCRNNLRQLGLAFQLHHDAHRHFPTNGWGWNWVGDGEGGFGQTQPGGWCFNVLPYLEQYAVRDAAVGGAGTAQALRTPLAVLYCPSRRSSRCYPVPVTSPVIFNSDSVEEAGRTDYAACGGDVVIHTPGGPPSAAPSVLQSYAWPPFQKATGIAFVRTQVRLADVTDGVSRTVMIGEKYLMRSAYSSGRSLGDDQPAFLGDDADNRRWADEVPRPDGSTDDIQHFGSAHSVGCHFVFCDGAVRLLAYGIDGTVFRRLGNRHDGVPADVGD